ncbi:PIN domain-containing protein, partial [candidate division WOR-3 bacterium]|nr:PIN domain-containing protein [candidate division WOR-3 bacterium]MBD3363748.1 PIN domain-containing protein [candidate division WOR-3 bacterium]
RSGEEQLLQETWDRSVFTDYGGLEGLIKVDMVNFDLTLEKARRDAFLYAYLQVGLSDIMHILLAHHLGCKFFATWDQDFARVKEYIEERTGIVVICKDVDRMIRELVEKKCIESE